MIKNLADLAEMLSAEPNEKSISRNVYKYTDCGAWIEFRPDSIMIGSIVEGSNFGTMMYRLNYPFTEADYRAREAAVEKEADALWEWANKTAKLGASAPDFTAEFAHLNPEGRSS